VRGVFSGAIEELDVQVMRDDRRAFADEISQAGDMIEVRVCHDDVTDRFSRNRLLGQVDQGARSRFALHAVDYNRVIVKRYGNRLVGAVKNEDAG
jgi:hypothetical protein